MEFPTYDQMKYSGVDYLGYIPCHWETRRLKFYTDRVYTGSTPPSSESDYYLNTTEDWFTPSDFSDDKINLTDSNRKLSIKAVEDGVVKRFPGKSVLVVGIGATLGKIGLTSSPFLCNQQINVIIPSQSMDADFLAYSLRVKVEVMKIISNATTLGIMNQEKTKLIELSVPEKDEQTQIAKFLDYKTAQIDRLIEKKKALIEKLNEQRIAMITQAVTKGLNPDAPMKDSEVDWLGEVPEHWEVIPIKFALDIPITDGPHETPELLNDGVPFISAEAVKNDRLDFSKKRGFISEEEHQRFSKKYSPILGDVYMVKSGATTGNVARVETHEKFNIWSPLAVLRPKPLVSSTDFLFYFLKSLAFKYSVELSWSYGTQQNIGMGVIANLKIALPPYDEQNAINAFLAEECKNIDKMLAVNNKTIDKLNEYRTALITAAVTGKIDVREVEIPEQGAA